MTEVYSILGLSNVRYTIRMHCREEKGRVGVKFNLSNLIEKICNPHDAENN